MKTIITSPQRTKIKLSELQPGECFSFTWAPGSVYMVLHHSGEYIISFCFNSMVIEEFVDEKVITLTMDPDQTIKFNL
jgi:hypothetical protein